MNSFQSIINVIESFNDIFILHHIHPDYDCLGAQFGLASWLKSRYPEKTIRCGGHEKGYAADFFPELDYIDEAFAKQALCVLVDTASLDRIDGSQWYAIAKEHLYIDHHIKRTPTFTYEYVDETASSTCEIIANMASSVQTKPLDTCSAQYLYAGMISDSIRFSINTTTSKTLDAASYLLKSNIDLNAINRTVFSVSPQIYQYSNEIRLLAHYMPSGLVYAVVPYSLWSSYSLTLSDAKSRVGIFGEIKGIRAWALVCELEDGSYSASIRSHTIALDDIANEYGGGGHRCACGIGHIDKDDLEGFIRRLENRVLE